MAKAIQFKVRDGDGAVRKCRACNADVLFWTHPTTRNTLPLDVKGAIPADEPGYKLMESHFATCTNPGRFRRRG